MTGWLKLIVSCRHCLVHIGDSQEPGARRQSPVGLSIPTLNTVLLTYLLLSTPHETSTGNERGLLEL